VRIRVWHGSLKWNQHLTYKVSDVLSEPVDVAPTPIVAH